MIKVLIVEDSPVMQQLLAYTITKDPVFTIVGIAENGEEAIKAVKKYHPDIITMDWHMPKLDGLQATRMIMETNPIPIVIVSGSSTATDVGFSFRMIEAGALSIVKKPLSVDHPDYQKEASLLIQTLKLMSEIKLVRRIPYTKKIQEQIKTSINNEINEQSEIQAIAMGASTGGPLVLQKILSGLPRNLPFPILIVQHISPGFIVGFVEWLNNTTNFPIHIATQGEYMLSGHAYVAPDNFHMGVETKSRILLSTHEPENGLRPSVAFLFRTTAQVYGSKAVGVLLSGMGCDGAEELKLMKENGAMTIAQDFESSAVHGMPGEAIKINAATHVFSPDKIVMAITSLVENVKEKSYERPNGN